MEASFAAELERRADAAHELMSRLATAPPAKREELLWQLRREAHTLRGSALVLGLDDVVAFAADLEQLARAGDIDLAALEGRLERVLAGLPRSEPAAQAERSPSAGAERKILCVDDSEPNLLLLERYLARRGGVAFVPARTGEEAIELAAREQPDVVLLDLQLPDASGLDVMERLQADARTASIPIVIVSADAHEQQLTAAQERGARDYLVKPLDLTRLAAVIDAVFLSADNG